MHTQLGKNKRCGDPNSRFEHLQATGDTRAAMNLEEIDCFGPGVCQRTEYYARIKRVTEHIRQNIDDRLTLQDAASIACMEKTSFSKCFKRRVGISFSQYLRAYRIAMAINEMKRSDSSITEIAFGVGFSSSTAFGRAFKQVTGSSPSKYLNEIRRERGLVAPI